MSTILLRNPVINKHLYDSIILMNVTSPFTLKSLESWAFLFFSLLVGLLPFFFIPVLPVGVIESKSYLLCSLAFLSGALVFIDSLYRRTIRFPRSWTQLCFLVVPLLVLVSAFFSSSVRESIFGNAAELSTVITLSACCIVGFLSSIFLIDNTKRDHATKFFFGGILISSIFQLVLFIGNGFQSGLLLGSIVDFGIVHAFALLLAAFVLSVRKNTHTERILLLISSALSVLFILLSQLMFIWIAIGIVSLVLFISILFTHTSEDPSKRYSFPTFFFILILLSLFSTIGALAVQRIIPAKLAINITEIRPSASTTFSIAKDIVRRSPLVGVGPNRFEEALELYKPDIVSSSQFSATSFSFGFAFFPTIAIETGLLGLLAILFLLGAGAYSLFKLLKNKFAYENPLAIFSTVGFLYFLVFLIWFVPTVIPIVLFFVFTGILVGLECQTKMFVPTSLEQKSSFPFVTIVVSSLLVVVLASGFLFSLKKTIARGIFSYGVLEVGKGNIVDERFMELGYRIDRQDSYARSIALLYLSQTTTLLSGLKDQTSKPEDVQAALSKAIAYAKNAMTLDSNDAHNYVVAGDVYAAVVPVKAERAYENAAAAYEAALVRSPHNPDLILRQANLEATAGNVDQSFALIEDSLQIKPLFADAYILRSHIYAMQGNSSEAMATLQEAQQLLPTDPDILLGIGHLGYDQNNLAVAVPALLALISQNVSVEGHYLLGLSYDRLGRKSEAIGEFSALVEAFPDNQTFQTILARLQAGQSAQ